MTRARRWSVSGVDVADPRTVGTCGRVASIARSARAAGVVLVREPLDRMSLAARWATRKNIHASRAETYAAEAPQPRTQEVAEGDRSTA